MKLLYRKHSHRISETLTGFLPKVTSYFLIFKEYEEILFIYLNKVKSSYSFSFHEKCLDAVIFFKNQKNDMKL